MATSNGGGNRGRSGQNNNPAGHNQFDRGWVDSARDRPIAAAAAVGGVVAAGIFLWSKRNQISEQISSLSDQIGDWREGMQSDGSNQGFMAQGGGSQDQSDFAEEALTLKQTGKKARRPADPTIDSQTKAGSVAY
jgi:hypothetical protein